jgi:hypothetical protein
VLYNYHIFCCQLGTLLLRQEAFCVGDRAAQNYGVLQSQPNSSVAEFMMEFGLVRKVGGAFALSSIAIQSGVRLGNAVLESLSRDGSSVFEILRLLAHSGWTAVELARDASIQHKLYLKEGHKQYYRLLAGMYEQVKSYAELNNFSHGQGVAYYNAVEAAFLHCDPHV